MLLDSSNGAYSERKIRRSTSQTPGDDWQSGFSQWLSEIYQSKSENMLEIIEPALDKVMIDFALEKTGGKKQEAAKVLGLGRNTLTKKIKAQQS